MEDPEAPAAPLSSSQRGNSSSRKRLQRQTSSFGANGAQGHLAATLAEETERTQHLGEEEEVCKLWPCHMFCVKPSPDYVAWAW
jgi:hypothetical protein